MLPMWKCCQSQCCQFSIGAQRERDARKAVGHRPYNAARRDASPYQAMSVPSFKTGQEKFGLKFFSFPPCAAAAF